MPTLRRIALTVCEDLRGEFKWKIIESIGDAIVYDEVLSAGEIIFGTYIEALDAGWAVLREYAGEEGQGPRRFDEDENSSPVDDADFG